MEAQRPADTSLPSLVASIFLALTALLPSVPATAAAAEAEATALPWEPDYGKALAKAGAEHRPIFLMLTATWCGPCKLLEKQTLPSPVIVSAMKEFVWVKAYEDKALNEKFQLAGYPTLVFLDSTGDQVLEKTVGYQQPGPFLKHIIAARAAAKLPLNAELKKLQAKSFTLDPDKIKTWIRDGNASALTNYLAALRQDLLRDGNFVVLKLHLPPGLKPDDVQASAGGDLPVPASGLMLVGVPRDGSALPFRVTAPGCKQIDETIGVDETNAVAAREFTLRKLQPAEAAVFSGRVLGAEGHPVPKAIVRICDWDVTRTDSEGSFKFSLVTPGTFLVRAEAPGGEFHEELTFAAGQSLPQDLNLKAVTTVGIRWALQHKEGSRELAGEGVTTGEAYFSVEHSRFLLSRGAQVPQYYGSDFMLMADWKGVREYISKEQVAELEASNNGAPIFWLFDAGGHPNGLHAEDAGFEEIRSINNGQPYDEKQYFKFLRGETVRKGKVYTVRCVRKDCYAKTEITDVTIVPPDASK